MAPSAPLFKEGDYAMTLSGRKVRVVKKLPEGMLQCSYASFGGTVRLKAENLSLEADWSCMKSDTGLLEFELSEDDLNWLRETTGMDESSELNAIAWRALGLKHGFQWKTAIRAPGKGEEFLLARPICHE